MKKDQNVKHELLTLKNVGKATYNDLELLGITSILQLSHAEPDDLFSRLEILTGHPQDPCVWDVFAAIIHEAKTGEKTSWWDWTKMRKMKK